MMTTNKSTKNIVICLDGTGNQFGENLSNVVKLYRMLAREPGQQVTYYDPGVGTMGDANSRTSIGKKISKALGLAFGRGLIQNVLEAYTYLMNNYNDGDKVFIFGFSRGAYTARALAAFIKEYGLFEKGAINLFPYAMELFHEKAPTNETEKVEFFKIRSRFRSTYGRLLNRSGDPRNPKSKDIPNYQLRVQCLGLFDTVKSYGGIRNPNVLRNEEENPAVLNVRHAISIDEKRAYFHQMHWKVSKRFQNCKEVWFAGVHSDVGGGYAEHESGLAKIPLEWMVHEAISLGLIVDQVRYGKALNKKRDGERWINREPVMVNGKLKTASPDPKAATHNSLSLPWKVLQIFPKKLETWEDDKSLRTIKSEKEREQTEKELNPVLIHQSVIERMAQTDYRPKNLLAQFNDDVKNITDEFIERTIPTEEVFPLESS